MMNARVIPCLLLKGRGLVKTVRFGEPRYLGDPLNAVKIFNEKEVHELIVLDIDATLAGRGPDMDFIREIASECFMPLCYGGGITSVKQVRDVLAAGAEKVCVNTSAIEQPEFVRAAADAVGSQSVIVGMDFRRTRGGGYEAFTRSGRHRTGLQPRACAEMMATLGAGELFVNSIDCDGMMEGFDLTLISEVASTVEIPIIACGGAGCLRHLADAVQKGGAAAAAAGSLFVFYGRNRAVLLNYPSADELSCLLGGNART